jgi:hypothetical protein
MPHRSRLRTRSPAVLACLAAAAPLAAGTSATASPVAHAARSCSTPKYPGLGYFTSLSVKGVSCASGRQLIVAYYHCRTRSGPAGRCTGRVLGFACRERRNSIPTEIDARVTCQRRGQTVIHTYQQDL